MSQGPQIYIILISNYINQWLKISRYYDMCALLHTKLHLIKEYNVSQCQYQYCQSWTLQTNGLIKIWLPYLNASFVFYISLMIPKCTAAKRDRFLTNTAAFFIWLECHAVIVSEHLSEINSTLCWSLQVIANECYGFPAQKTLGHFNVEERTSM